MLTNYKPHTKRGSSSCYQTSIAIEPGWHQTREKYLPQRSPHRQTTAEEPQVTHHKNEREPSLQQTASNQPRHDTRHTRQGRHTAHGTMIDTLESHVTKTITPR